MSYPSRDDRILVSLCKPHGIRAPIVNLSVDDLDDPDEFGQSTEEIHCTAIIADGRRDETGPCFSLSVTSARLLIDALTEAVRRREDGR